MNKTRLFLLLCICIAFSGLSQPLQPIEIPLTDYLQQLEKQHGVYFNYAVSNVSGLKIKPPPPNLPLQEKIAQLDRITKLDFEFGSANSITISKRKIQDSPDTVLVQPLEEVVVRHYLTTGISRKSDGSFRINPKKFGILPGLIEPDVLQTLQQLPGILSIDETVSNINVRGGTHDQNLFLWNGIRMFQTGHFFGLISAFNPSLPQQISVHKNGTPAFWGEGVSSAVLIESSTAEQRHDITQVAVNMISAEMYTHLNLNPRASVSISARRSYTDFARTPTYNSFTDRIFQNTLVTDLQTDQNIDYKVDESFHFYDFSAQYKQLIGNRSEFTLSTLAISNSLDLETTQENSLLKSENYLRQRQMGTSLVWKTRWNSQNSTEISGYVSGYKLLAEQNSVENNQRINQENGVLDTGLRLRNFHRLSERFQIENGYQYNETGVSNFDNVSLPAYRRDRRDVLRSHALIGQLRYISKNNKLLLQPGIRFNYYEKFARFLPEPRFQAQYALHPNWRIEFLGEAKSQTLSQVIDMQQDFLGLEKRRWILADQNQVPIQKSLQSSLGISFEKNGWLLTAEGFYKNVDGISSMSQAFQNQLEFRKLQGDYRVWGSELLAQKKWDALSCWLSYSYNRNDYTFSQNLPSEFASNFEILHAFSAATIYQTSQLKLALGAKWLSGKNITTPLSNQTSLPYGEIAYHDPNNSRLGDYFQVNFSAAYGWEIGGESLISAGVSVLNVLNTQNTINRYYRINATNDNVERVNTLSLGRTPNFCLRLTF